MVKNADKIGGGTTALNDPRITKVGNILRKTKLDEIPQLFNIFAGIAQNSDFEHLDGELSDGLVVHTNSAKNFFILTALVLIIVGGFRYGVGMYMEKRSAVHNKYNEMLGDQ